MSLAFIETSDNESLAVYVGSVITASVFKKL